MTCGEIEKALPAYLEDALPPGEKKLVGEHISSCQACGSACENLKKASELVGTLEEVEPPPWLAQRSTGIGRLPRRPIEVDRTSTLSPFLWLTELDSAANPL